eukprot:156695-Pyramimonas_sp.AAC.1
MGLVHELVGVAFQEPLGLNQNLPNVIGDEVERLPRLHRALQEGGLFLDEGLAASGGGGPYRAADRIARPSADSCERVSVDV